MKNVSISTMKGMKFHCSTGGTGEKSIFTTKSVNLLFILGYISPAQSKSNRYTPFTHCWRRVAGLHPLAHGASLCVTGFTLRIGKELKGKPAEQKKEKKSLIYLSKSRNSICLKFHSLPRLPRLRAAAT